MRLLALLVLVASLGACSGEETGQATAVDNGGSASAPAEPVPVVPPDAGAPPDTLPALTPDALPAPSPDARPAADLRPATPDAKAEPVTAATIEPALVELGNDPKPLRFTVTNTGNQRFMVRWAGLSEFIHPPTKASVFSTPACFAGPFLIQSSDPDHCGEKYIQPGQSCHVDVRYDGARGCAANQRVIWLAVSQEAGPTVNWLAPLAKIVVEVVR